MSSAKPSPVALRPMLAALTLAASASAAATTLDFAGNICDLAGGVCGAGSYIKENYGDIAGVLDVQYLNLIGEPGITQLRYWPDSYSDLFGVAWTSGGDLNSRAEIFLKPLNGGSVTLNGFDLGSWPTTSHNTQVSVLDGDGNLLFDSGAISINGAVHSHFGFTTVASASGIRIQWGPSAYNVGIDNIDFGLSNLAPVPLPAPAWLLGGGLLTLAARRRRTA